MKIAIVTKIMNFTDDLASHWVAKGHEVKRGVDLTDELGEWMDCAFFDFVGEEIANASQSQWADKPLVGRLNRIEYHEKNLNRYEYDWSKIQALVFGSAWYMRLVREHYPRIYDNVPFVHVPYGVDASKFTFRERSGEGLNIAWIAKTFAWKKAPIYALQVLHMLVSETGQDWQLNMRVARGDVGFQDCRDYLIESFPTVAGHVTFYGWVPDVNEWLEPMDYILSTSRIEAFHYVVGEAMLKGIKPLVRAWAGSLEIWPNEYIWLSHQELLRIIQNIPYDSHSYREFVEASYPLEGMAAKLEELLSGRSL